MKKIVLIVLLACMISCNGGNPDDGTVNTEQSIGDGTDTNMTVDTDNEARNDGNSPDTEPAETDDNNSGEIKQPDENLPPPGSTPFPIPSDWDLASEPFDPVIHADKKAAWEALRISSYRFLVGMYASWRPTFIDTVAVYPDGTVWMKIYPNGTIWEEVNGDAVPEWYRTTFDNIFDLIPIEVADYARYGGECYIRYNPTYHYPELFYVVNNTWGSDAPCNIVYVQNFEVLE